ncbi:phosphoadenosine phosphosulfate reductase domain-containing protein [Alicyclobacillus cycloheptanicus]|uniref:phosphoadenosine phosphosulfate reductase domain-containing protein n=1 Tax=Alicyclobacillus cycloheptanicus TaxID=1457 RepID=UPI0027D7E03A|nr:phosphoadenosine phosphosulfate reductase family protein [Alicyclobacillus cycloheptanicus]
MTRTPVHVAMFSGGASSAYVAYLMAQRYGKENSILFFTDTLWEHEDNYRFMYDVATYIGLEVTRRVDGRTPEEVFEETRFLGNSRLAKCSSQLKVRQTVIFIEELRSEGYEPILYFGIGPHEKHRKESLAQLYSHQALEPVETRFPLIDLNLSDSDIKSIIENEWKIELPLMYKMGFSHANCGGRCVRGGFNHYRHLYLTWPDEYRKQEECSRSRYLAVV